MTNDDYDLVWLADTLSDVYLGGESGWRECGVKRLFAVIRDSVSTQQNPECNHGYKILSQDCPECRREVSVATQQDKTCNQTPQTQDLASTEQKLGNIISRWGGKK
jgi:hypothetical protein